MNNSKNTLNNHPNTVSTDQVNLSLTTNIDTLSIIKTLSVSLPDYMVPKRYLELDSLPLTHNGKISREALKQYGIEQLAPQKNITKNKQCRNEKPKSLMEKQLAALWVQVLDTKQPIFRHDDFFDLGAQSLDAIRLIAYIKQTLNLSVSLAGLWQSRQLSTMAKDIEDQLDKISFQSLQVIRGSNTAGQQSSEPWFIVHPAGGHIISYNELSQHLACPVFGFQALGLVDEKEPLTSVKDMASLYVKELLEHLKETPVQKPLAIAGWSSGSMIAFEICHQLLSLGHAVGSLVVIDCPAPLDSEIVSDQQLMHWFIEDLNLSDIALKSEEISDLLPLTAGFSDMDTLAQLNYALNLLSQHKPLPMSLKSETLLSTYRVFKAVIRAGRAYQPQRLNLPIYLARAIHGRVAEFAQHSMAHESSWGWEKLSEQAVYCQLFSANHHSILTSNSASSLAEFMNDSRQDLSRCSASALSSH